MPSHATIDGLLKRFGGATVEMLDRVLTPYRLRLVEVKIGADGRSGKFVAKVPRDAWSAFEEGTTGKVVPGAHVEHGGPWREVIKARILETRAGKVSGELYFVPARIKVALAEVKKGDYIEIDPFGVTSKIESALCEAAFFQTAREQGFVAKRKL